MTSINPNSSELQSVFILTANTARTTPMEPSSTVNQQWMLCTVASFIGCFILMLCLNQGHSRISPLHLQGMATSTTTTRTPKQFLMSNRSDGMEQIVQTEGMCDVFDGKWVFDSNTYPIYQASECPFLSDQVSCQRNGRPDSDYEQWRWEAKGCEIPRFNGTDMLERLRGKRVVIVGDSLNRNQWESLACLLYSAVPSSRAEVHVGSGLYKVFRAKDYKCSVEFFWSPFLVQLDENQANGSTSSDSVLRLDRLHASVNRWRGADVMVFNTGHWWAHRGKLKAWDFFNYNRISLDNLEVEAAFEMAMKTWANWIDRNINPAKTTVFFRSISPEHKRRKHWCHKQTQPIMDESYEGLFPKLMIEIVERTLKEMRTPVKYLNITRLSEYRKDAHPSVYTSKGGKLLTEKQRMEPESYADCSHWCLPGLPDTWNNLLYASTILETSKDIL